MTPDEYRALEAVAGAMPSDAETESLDGDDEEAGEADRPFAESEESTML